MLVPVMLQVMSPWLAKMAISNHTPAQRPFLILPVPIVDICSIRSFFHDPPRVPFSPLCHVHSKVQGGLYSPAAACNRQVGKRLLEHSSREPLILLPVEITGNGITRHVKKVPCAHRASGRVPVSLALKTML